MNTQELNIILDSHAKWLRSEKDGMRANLRGANLQSAGLRRADLEGANLSGANLRGAGLSGAGLSGANYISQWQSPLGEKRICYSVRHANCVMHKLGCFWGTTEQAVEAICEKYGNDSMYEELLVLNAKALAD